MNSGRPDDAPQLDLMPSEEVVGLLLDAEARVVPAIRNAIAPIVAGAELIAARLSQGGRLAFVGAGTSGRLAVVEAAELPGTFGLPTDLILARVAGGGAEGLTGTDSDEDDTDAAQRDFIDLGLGSADTVVAVAASGTTPYTLALAEAARAKGGAVIAVVNAVGSPLAKLAEVAIEAPLGPEVLRGSTRLTAGTAQKVVLNALTTTAMVRFGRVHGQVMVDVVAANAKLRDRAAGIVAEIAGCDVSEARVALEAADWNARAAVLHIVSGIEIDQAAKIASAHRSLRDALADLPG